MEGGLAYADAMADDAQLTLAVAATGFAYGGAILPRAEVVEAITGAHGRIDGVVVRDLESSRTLRLRAHLVVNAAGVWVDRVREAFGIAGRRSRPSRGSHIIVSGERLPLHSAVTLPSPDDGRPVFMIPHPEGVLVGTTDIYHEGSLDDPRPTADEVGYLLRALQSYFLEAQLSKADIVGAFAGLRPILDTHAENPSEASREEDVWEERGLLTVAGGKLTTWRVTAQEAVDDALPYLPMERAERAAPCHTHGTPLDGLAPADLASRLARCTTAPPEVVAAMARRLRAGAFWALRVARDAKELEPLVEGCDLSAAEVRVHLAFGAVLRLEDLLLRRVRVGMWSPPLARVLAPRLRTLFEQELAWDRRRWDAERTSFETALEAWSPEGVG
jgi:glycerol-3-phosphate dehydrogenase